MNKKILMSLFAIFFLVITLNFVVSVDVCCVEPKDPDQKWCRDLPQTQAATECNVWRPTVGACAGYPGCETGVCVSGDSGECVSSSWKDYCESNPLSSWFDLPVEEILVNGLKVCQKGCCFYGDSSNLLTFAKCKAIAGSQGVDFDFDPTITDKNTCIGLSGGKEEVACIIQDDFFRDCYRTTAEECLSVGGDPEEGLLCTATQLATNCARSKDTICFENKVYFTDTCGTLANIYVESKFNNTDYWTKIKSSNKSCSIPLTDTYSSTCGNCNEIEGTICRDYKGANDNTLNHNLNKPKYGENICAPMDCYYDTDGDSSTPKDLYLHGESWCAESVGTIFHINISNESGQFQQQDKTRELLTNFDIRASTFQENYNKYNVPGTKYSRLYCVDGSVHVNSCNDYRSEICVETDSGDITGNSREGTCVTNDWQSCLEITNVTECEDGVFCKWVQGYRFDSKKLTDKDDRNFESQGSCIPLFSPGVKFWFSEGDDPEELKKNICNNLSFVDGATYELSWTRSREKFADRPTCLVSASERNFDATTTCIGNCYLIPDYGKDNSWDEGYFPVSTIKGVHEGESLPEKFENYCISDRKQYYCYVDGATIITEVGQKNADCAVRLGERKEFPVFFTHDEWINATKDRTRSFGDCGYKQGLLMESSEGLSKDLESIWAIFMKLDQNGAQKEEYGAEKIYYGDFEFVEGGGYRDKG